MQLTPELCSVCMCSVCRSWWIIILCKKVGIWLGDTNSEQYMIYIIYSIFLSKRSSLNDHYQTFFSDFLTNGSSAVVRPQLRHAAVPTPVPRVVQYEYNGHGYPRYAPGPRSWVPFRILLKQGAIPSSSRGALKLKYREMYYESDFFRGVGGGGELD